jgi:hypothetical protein
MQVTAFEAPYNVSRARRETRARAYAGKGLPKQKLPVGACEGDGKVAHHHPTQRRSQHTCRAEPIRQASARNLHQRMRQEDAGR